jgi:UDP-GlcNAc:undecaprenyl-phosphate GlcNAc-1-phosphate transferase
LAIYTSVVVVTLGVLFLTSLLTSGEITFFHYTGILLGGLWLMIGGLLDDRYRLPPYLSIAAPALAAITAIICGVEVDKLTNPFGGIIILAPWQSDILVFVWLMGVMYTTKFLDGLDGLATSVSSVGAFMILLLALTAAYYQPDVALFATIILGALLGFLFWNYHPASIFLGEGGSTLVGFLLGILAVISGGKLATALLVLGIPVMDVAWVIVRRGRHGGWRAIWKGDRKHLHHRLLDMGWGQRRVMLFYVCVSTALGLLALLLQSGEKLVALVVLSVLMALGASYLVHKDQIASCDCQK